MHIGCSEGSCAPAISNHRSARSGKLLLRNLQSLAEISSRTAKLLGVKCLYAISGIMSIFKKRPQNEKDCVDELVKSPVSKEALAQIARQRPTVKHMKEEDEDNEEDESHS